METPLLVTKLVVPPARPGLVPRSHLTDRLTEGLGFSLVLVSAPAGFGKTTLLSDWARSGQSGVRTAWVSLDDGDNDPVRFWDYFLAALRTIHPGCGERALPWLHSPQPPPIESILAILINDLSKAPGKLAIILDDYHLIRSQQIHDGIAYFIEHLPSHIRLVIAARADPPLQLAHFRGKGMLLEVRTDDLRFSLDDAASLLKEMKASELSDTDIAALNERTEGWAIGLKMAALSMKGQNDVPGFINAFTGSQRYIMDYLMEEVLQKQTQELKEFLLKTSVLDRLTGPLCDELTGRSNSRDMLIALERGHLFIVPLDEERQWYRYEHLFADLLRHQCETAQGTEYVAGLHRRASQWYEDSNLPDEAIHHALTAEDWQRALRLIDAYHEARWKRGEFNTLLGWLQPIPHDIFREHHHLYSLYASILASAGRLEEAEEALGYLEAVGQDDTIRASVAFARGILYKYQGDIRCIELLEKAFKLLPRDDIAMRSRVAVNIAHARQRHGPLREAEKWATIACELGKQAGDILGVAQTLSQLAIIAAYQGKLKRAAALFETSNQFNEKNGLGAADYGLLCWVHYFLNNLDTAIENAMLGDTQDKPDLVALFVQAMICLARGDTTGAEIAITRLDQVQLDPTIDSTWHAWYIASRVLYCLRLGNQDEAARWGERLPDYHALFVNIRYIPARLLLTQGRKEAAVAFLREIYDDAARFGARLAENHIRIYQALAADDEEQALAFLTEALTMAEPEGIIRFFVDEGRPLKPLLDKALDRGITPEFTRRLLDIIDDEERQRQAATRTAVPTPPPGILSARELEILRLLTDNVSNQQIAASLSISLGTVKTHVHHIIEKLEVKDRRQAVQRARELKLM